MNAIAIISVILKISIFLTALGYGLKTTSEDAFYLIRKPGLLLRSVLAMNIIMPVVALLIAHFSALSPLVKVALVGISISPLAPLFPRKPLHAGGRRSYVIGLMLTASLLTLILIPLTLKILDIILVRPVNIAMKEIVASALISVIVPLFSGIALRYFAPAFSKKFGNPVARISQIMLGIALLPVLVKMFPAVIHLIGNGTVLAIAVFSITGLLAGHFLGGPDPADRSVLAMAAASRHPAIAIAVASANLPGQKLVPAAILLYLIVSALIVFPYLKWIRKPAPGNQTRK
ncbi:bile acid:sodium symporter family protein [Adhaeribacter soli]|uniref:Na+-dependent transporter n=1 Tax=Adhaeribacter soli TaxID=2607655 RepID=A0A5N1IX42_9BACT|nr:Na+-dependent transporter [Adhaeribacter soli]KAA9332623.1 Na+-dependent transporter [Adhaeribacter soli]